MVAINHGKKLCSLLLLTSHKNKQGGSVICVCTQCSNPAHPHFHLIAYQTKKR